MGGVRRRGAPAVDALCHVDVVARGAAGTVFAHLRLDRDGLRRADCLAELARDAALFAGRIPAQRVLSAEAGADGALLHGVVEGNGLLEEHEEGERHAS